jgi:hypothetical protein
MNGKITLITPPDFFENSTLSVLLTHINEEEQDTISRWLSKSEFREDINLYVYSGETNVGWFLYALNRCEYKYINLNDTNYITQSLSGYALSKNGVYYRTDDENIASVYTHINANRVNQVENFLESILGVKTN